MVASGGMSAPMAGEAAGEAAGAAANEAAMTRAAMIRTVGHAAALCLQDVRDLLEPLPCPAGCRCGRYVGETYERSLHQW